MLPRLSEAKGSGNAQRRSPSNPNSVGNRHRPRLGKPDGNWIGVGAIHNQGWAGRPAKPAAIKGNSASSSACAFRLPFREEVPG